ncbi:phosphotransferase [Photobacterium lipolyticum]|uniref:Phosphotransferase n=1 Tax=Photobacterium lipolyticum TaxID=266810 RepID=A0A2T3MZI1_9GAMM|nr:phosphotransferase [Photobacterium lipolyticum]PSW05390.1 phosphotransferase [Photobacterium lipolyticum]
MNKPQLKLIAEKTYKAMFSQQPELCNIQETFYGWIVFLVSPKGKFVVKFSREYGRISKEIEGLKRLKKALDCPVPEVYLFGREEGHDYLVMEWLDGVSAYELPSDPKALEIFREHYTDILIALHDCQSEKGFEIDREHFDPCLINAFDAWMYPVLRYVLSCESPFSSQLKSAYSQLWEKRVEILSPINTSSSLVHDDCHIANVLFDPKTFKVAAILDPCDVGYKHREFDIFHLFDVREDLKLAERYQEKTPLTDGFETRRWFLSLWDDAKHSRNMGWYDESWLVTKLDQFNIAYKQG